MTKSTNVDAKEQRPVMSQLENEQRRRGQTDTRARNAMVDFPLNTEADDRRKQESKELLSSCSLQFSAQQLFWNELLLPAGSQPENLMGPPRMERTQHAPCTFKFIGSITCNAPTKHEDERGSFAAWIDGLLRKSIKNTHT